MVFRDGPGLTDGQKQFEGFFCGVLAKRIDASAAPVANAAVNDGRHLRDVY